MAAPGNEIHILGSNGGFHGVLRPQPPAPSLGSWLRTGGLFLLTLVTTTAFAVLRSAPPEWFENHAGGFGNTLFQLFTDLSLLFQGLSFSLPLLAILLAHEMAHFWACRKYRLDASLPYFLPAPFGIGTLGAFIRIRSPLFTKRELLAVGASGPLAGFFVTLPFLYLGIAKSQVVAELPQGGYLIFGEPLLFNLLAKWVHPQLAQGGDLLLHPTAFAAWFGLLVTALNLLPFGQLDGGHIAYAALGRLHRLLAWPLLFGLVFLGLKWTGWWVWAIVALVMGVRHPWIPGEEEALGPQERLLALVAFAVFLLCFTPEPIKFVP